MTLPHISESSNLGTRVHGGHWYRGTKAYGGPPPVAFVVHLWWPVSDPDPMERWWR